MSIAVDLYDATQVKEPYVWCDEWSDAFFGTLRVEYEYQLEQWLINMPTERPTVVRAVETATGRSWEKRDGVFVRDDSIAGEASMHRVLPRPVFSGDRRSYQMVDPSEFRKGGRFARTKADRDALCALVNTLGDSNAMREGDGDGGRY